MNKRPHAPVATRIVDKQAILRGHWLFSKLDARIIDRLSACMLSRTFKRGMTIFTKGDESTNLFAVGSGTVRISVPSVDGRAAVFNLLEAGDIFGEIALLDGQPRTADAVAVTDCNLFTIERRDFLPLVANNAELSFKLIEVLCARLRHTTEQVEDILFLNLPMRLAKTLLRLGERSGASPARITITQRELGHLIGMSRESTNKQLREWEQKKWLRIDRGEVVLLMPDALAKISLLESNF